MPRAQRPAQDEESRDSSAEKKQSAAAPSAAGLPASLLGDEQLQSVLESLLFVAGRPMEMSELRRLLLVDDRRLRAVLDGFAADCERTGRGIRLQRQGDQAQLVSAPENARFVAALLGMPSQVKLTTAALETLAVVAYRQPITRSQIEFIRGVNSDRALASLLQHGLVVEVGRAATIGRPALFGTTPDFLQQFGLTSIEGLPQPEMSEAEAIEDRRARVAQRIREAIGTDEDSAE